MSETVNQAGQLANEVVKFAPPATYVAATKFLGMSPAEWVTWLTIIYLLIQLALALPKLANYYGPKITRQYLSLSLWIKSKRGK